MPDQCAAAFTRFDLQQHESLFLAHLRERCPLNRTRVKDRSGERGPAKIVPEHLMPVDVARKNGGEIGGQFGASDDVGRVPEREVGWAHRSPLHTMVHAEEADLGFRSMPLGLVQSGREPFANPATLIGEADQGHSNPPDLHHHGLRPMKDMQVGMERESGMGDPGSLVIPGHHEDRNACFGDRHQGAEGLEDQGRRDPRAVEYVSAVDDQIDVPCQGRLQGPLMVGEEVMPPPPPLHPRAGGEVESEVGVRQEENPYRT
jgi:hypothetical protein